VDKLWTPPPPTSAVAGTFATPSTSYSTGSQQPPPSTHTPLLDCNTWDFPHGVSPSPCPRTSSVSFSQPKLHTRETRTRSRSAVGLTTHLVLFSEVKSDVRLEVTGDRGGGSLSGAIAHLLLDHPAPLLPRSHPGPLCGQPVLAGPSAGRFLRRIRAGTSKQSL